LQRTAFGGRWATLIERNRHLARNFRRRSTGGIADNKEYRIDAAVALASALGHETLMRRWRQARSLPITGILGYEKVEVTAGGIRLDEVDSVTLESRLVPWFFICWRDP
jgi:predicted flavoprotein YhiN